MADKKITDLQQISAPADGNSIPIDDGIQTYRATGAQLKNYILPDGSINFAKLASEVVDSFTPPGVVAPYIASTAPSGWLLCHGQAVSRVTYANLFSLIDTKFGNGDGSTTFNLPDLRGRFLRGINPISNVTGSGSASSNNATFTAHGYTRKGTRVRLASGTLSGLVTATDYYLIIIDENTLAFANSYANALADTKLALTGSNSAVIAQWEDPDASARVVSAPGGATGNNIGSLQPDSVGPHNHRVTATMGATAAGLDGGATGLAGWNNGFTQYMLNTANARPYVENSTGNESRPLNVLVNYIIKV